MQLPLYQVDAFTSRLFGGNPAAIVPLTAWLPDELLQAIAAENNLAETAYLVQEGEHFRIRWFTPAVEVDLCGHATLAAAFVLTECLGSARNSLAFESRSGQLRVTHDAGLYTLDFPSLPASEIEMDVDVVNALGRAPAKLLKARDTIAVYEHEDDVRSLAPDLSALARLPHFAFIATAKGSECDFVSRFFAPAQGVDEDPVTGSGHCTLAPYWSGMLGRSTLEARQISKRGGELSCRVLEDRVLISGRAVLYLTGFISV